MATFICKAPGCPNEGVIYNLDDKHPPIVECGGCAVHLQPEEN